MPAFVGRSAPLARLTATYQALAAPPDRALSPWARLVLVTGEAGIGKTSVVTRFAGQVVADGGTVVWGSCWDGDQAPAWWPWTQALRTLLAQGDHLTDAVRPELAAVLPELATSPAMAGTDAASLLRVFEAAGHLLSRAAADTPVMVVLDDLHWADRSTVDLLRYIAHRPQSSGLMIVGAYRPNELAPDVAGAVADVATAAELVPLSGLSAGEVADLVQAVAGTAAPPHWAALVHERSGGHPFYARELCRLLAATGTAADVPAAVREVIRHRLARLSGACAGLLDAAAVAGSVLLPDVLAEVAGEDTTAIDALAAEAAAAGILAVAENGDGPTAFVHDLYRETIYTSLPPERRLDLHHRVAIALRHRRERGSPVFAAELAHHFTAAVQTSGTADALTWALAAAQADTARCAFVDAAGHLAKLRSALAATGLALPDADAVGLLTTEADLRLRSGDAPHARALLDTAWIRATSVGRPELIGDVALGLDRIDARFAMPRADLVAALTTARTALTGTGTTTEAKVTAALARQLQHSVPADRPQAQPLADEAVAVARTLDDPGTLASCLLAQHDTRWTPGTATARDAIAAEIADLAKQADDPERQAQALLLSATAQLENGSPAFRATLAQYAYLTEQLHQPRHDYLLRTRQAALALLDGDIDAGERLSAQAATLGDGIGEVDTGNVRMSQRLEVVRARNHPGELRTMAADAVRWWIGAPAHAHAVAAGFAARAGDLDAARRELDTVLTLDDWRADRSYLWSVFVGEMATAAIAVHDRSLCQRLLDDLLPLGDTCAVNAAFVCFMGANAHRIGLLYAALGQPDPARHWLRRALETHRTLGARAWQADTHRALGDMGGPEAHEHAARARSLYAELRLTQPATVQRSDIVPELRWVGDLWQASYRGQIAYLRDSRGLHDLAALLTHPRTDLAALHLAGSRRAPAGDTERVLDRTALLAYRRRLAELDDDLATARNDDDLARQQHATNEREQLLAELRRATRPDGTARPFANTDAERARKAVTARIRDAIRHITAAHPDLGAHLDRTVRTGTTCRYDP
ncbi:MAG TPA: AAA family ATPase [Actinoplanes sp.]